MDELPADFELCPSIGLEDEDSPLACLSPRERAFVVHFCRLHSAKKAAVAAGYAADTGSVLRRRPRVAEAIHAVLAAQGFTEESIRGKFAAQSQADMADYEPWLSDPEMTLEDLRARGVDTSLIRKATVQHTKMGPIRRLELYDAPRALANMSRMLGMFKPTGAAEIAVNAKAERTSTVLIGQLVQQLVNLRVPLPAGIGAGAAMPDGQAVPFARLAELLAPVQAGIGANDDGQ